MNHEMRWCQIAGNVFMENHLPFGLRKMRLTASPASDMSQKGRKKSAPS